MTNILEGVSIYKPAIQAGLLAIEPVFGGSYTDEDGNAFTVQVRGQFSTERREVPNVEVSFRGGATMFFNGNNMISWDPVLGNNLAAIYIFDATIRYTVQGRGEAEREWLMDTLTTAFTGLVFTDPSTGDVAINNVVRYLGSQGIIAKGWDAPDYTEVVLSDARPEGQVYQAVLPIRCDISLQYFLPGVSTATAVFTPAYTIDTTAGWSALGPFAQTELPITLPL